MVKKFIVEATRGKFKIEGWVLELGEDLLVCLWGGTRPHIGAVGMAVPRPSLQDPRRWSASSSNYTFVGHKEDDLVRKLSEKIAAGLQRNAVVIAGIHWDHLQPGQIKTIQSLVEELGDQVLKKLRGRKKSGKRAWSFIHPSK